MKQKGPKNSSQQKCFFALKAFAPQNWQNLGWDYFALALFASVAKTPYALPLHSPASFCQFSPEAVLLTHLGAREPVWYIYKSSSREVSDNITSGCNWTKLSAYVFQANAEQLKAATMSPTS